LTSVKFLPELTKRLLQNKKAREVRWVSSKDEITKGVLELLAEIANREKKKAVNRDDYFDAFIAQVLESWFKEARKSIN